MNSRPRHARKNDSRRTAQTLLRAGLMATAAGALVGAAAGSASAAGPLHTPTGTANTTLLDNAGGVPTQAVTGSLSSGAGSVARPAKSFRPNVLAGTPVNPLSNSVGTQVDDFKPVSSDMVTGQLAKGSSVSQLPVVGSATGNLPG